MSSKASILVFVGPPGSGKGTLAYQCVQKLGWVQLSTGNLCRKAVASGSALGHEIAAAINAGKLVPDTLIGTMVEEWLAQQLDAGKVVILDGYPRARTQAHLLHKFLQHYQEPITIQVVRFVVPQELLMRRLGTRLVCSNKDCQIAYSQDQQSSRLPTKSQVCDACGSPLIKRLDDNAQTAQERLSLYHRHEQDLLDFYQLQGNQILSLESDDTSDSVFERFCAMLEGICA